MLCVYDNAGESFLPGADTAASPVTRHLALSRVLMFLFDPTQDMRFRKLCSGKTNDLQMLERSERLDRERPVRQETILAEAGQRVRCFAGLGQSQRHPRPLIVAVTKFDAWSALLKTKELPTPYMVNSHNALAAVRVDMIDALSQKLRACCGKFRRNSCRWPRALPARSCTCPSARRGAAPSAIPAPAPGLPPEKCPADVGGSADAVHHEPVDAGFGVLPEGDAGQRKVSGRGGRLALEGTFVSQELIYTSVPRGLAPEARGSARWPAPAACRPTNAATGVLERLPATLRPKTPQAALNPVAFSHLVLTVAGRRCHVLSRVCDAGLDYSQRSNKFAHHVVLDAAELPAGGPAWLMAQTDFLRSKWDAEPSTIPAGTGRPAGRLAASGLPHMAAAYGRRGLGRRAGRDGG